MPQLMRLIKSRIKTCFDTTIVQKLLKEAITIWMLFGVICTVVLIVLWLPVSREMLWQISGEHEYLGQIKALSDIASDKLRPSLKLATNAVIPYTKLNPFGVNVFLEQEVELSKRERVVQMAHEAGFHWLRQEFPWEDIEIHSKGNFEDLRHKPFRSSWEKYDHIVDLAEKYELELIVRLSTPPSWSRQAGNKAGTKAPPDNFVDFADFVRAVVTRYKGRVQYYQIWNEPNIYPEWGNYSISPEAYTKLLKAGSQAAKAVDPKVVIIAAALAATAELQPDGHPPTNNLSDILFLQRMYNSGAAPYFDIMSVQAYGLFSGPTDMRLNPRVMNSSRHLFIRDVMVQNGDANKPIWISEMNWNASPFDWPNHFGHVTVEEQAQYLPLMYEQVKENWPWIGVVNVWYLKRPSDEWEKIHDPQAHFRLLTPDFEPLPVYDAIKSYIALWRKRMINSEKTKN